MSGQSLPLNFNSEKAQIEFNEVCRKLPNDIEVYLIGGALRNAIFRHIHGEVLKQRDYDQIITKNSKGYFEFLKIRGYEKGAIDRPTQRVMRKSFIPDANPESYEDWMVFDTHMVDGSSAIDNLRHHVGLTVNGFALSLKDVLSDDWEAKLVSLPGALEDMKNKQLRVNLSGYKDQAANFFACLRFMHAGFSAPPKEEIQLLLEELPKVEDDRFDRNVQKVWSYCDGEENARGLVERLGIDIDVFNKSELTSSLAK